MMWCIPLIITLEIKKTRTAWIITVRVYIEI